MRETEAIAQLFEGRHREAFATAQARLRARGPADVRMVLVLAAIALEHGNLAKVEELLALAADIGGAEGWRHVLAGRLALTRSDTARARAAAREAAAAGVDHPGIAGELGVLFSRTGLHAEALPWFRAAAASRPGDAQIAYNLAVALQFTGDLHGAEAAFVRLLELQPGHAKGWLALVQLRRQRDDALLHVLSREFESAGQAETRLTFGHAIAKVLEDLGRWDESLEWLERAKAATRAAVAHDRAATERLFAAARDSADAALPEASGDPGPVFIVGLPRSGTTLVERILSAHPAVRAAGELSDFAVLLKRRVATPGPLVLDAPTIRAAMEADLTGLQADYLARARAVVGDAPARIIDKMPFNLFFAPLILKAMPGARIVCLRRSPLDTLFSNFRQLFAVDYPYYSYSYDLADTAHFVAQFERLAEHFAHHLPPTRFRSQRYEDVVADFEGQARALVDFIGLEWDPACLAFHENAAPVATASSVQVRQPIYTSSLARWRRYTHGSRRALALLRDCGLDASDDPSPPSLAQPRGAP